MDPRFVEVHLSSGVRKVFGDLAAAVHFSEDFDQGLLKTLQDLSGGKAISVDDLIGSFPLLAEQTFKHVHTTGDDRAAKAWHELGSELLERGFFLKMPREVRRGR